jgi:AraC-like DNA-binding protein
VEYIAHKFGFSRASFYREWERHFDIAPKNHLLNSRLEAAALRLIYSRLPVADIAREVHFSGATAFYRKFKEHYGFSPAELRNDPDLWKNFVPDLIPVERADA